MERGSEWRKWDLHIHTPGTAKNDQFGNSEDAWEQYIDCLEKSDISVFGITDYFSIKNYIKLKEKQKQGRLKNKVLLPNVEMRMYPVTGKNTPINIHAIFDPALDESDLEREFFRQLQFFYRGSNYSCIDADLAKLGHISSEKNISTEDDAIKQGINVFSISPKDLKNIVEKDFFKGHIIIALSNGSQDGASGILSQGGNMKPIREEITRMSDIILSGNPSDVKYFCGESTTIDEVIYTYGSLKPCVSCSDAHNMATIGEFHNNRITWIKSDPTFEGLKQILFEPKERVRISDVKPEYKYDYNIIDYVEVNSDEVYNKKILFNQNLNTIIGGRSTGKSTLLASIASKFQLKNDIIDRKDFQIEKYIKDISNNVHVVWRDRLENNDREIEYFTQNEIANIINENKSERTFFEIFRGKADKREAYETYKSEESKKFSSIQSKVSQYFEKKRLYAEKKGFVKTLGDDKGISLEIAKLESEQSSLQKKFEDKKDVIEGFQAIDKELAELQKQYDLLNNEIDSLKKLLASDFLIINPDLSYYDVSNANTIRISERINQTLADGNQQLRNFINTIIEEDENKRKIIYQQIEQKKNDKIYVEGKQIFDENKNLAIIRKQLSTLSKSREVIKKETDILDSLKREYESLFTDIICDHMSYLDLMNTIVAVLVINHDNITLSSSYEVKSDFRSKLEESLSLRSSSMVSLIDGIVKCYESKSIDEIQKEIECLMHKAIEGELTFKNGCDVKTFITTVLSNNWYKLKYDVNYQNDNLSEMSPGKRSFVVLKLLLDFSDKKCPILIDQPEDNLDNRAIYNELVKYIREKKKERQIILVTHNPNIVVGADSEEVIVANQNGKNSPNDGAIKFQYVSGSLENSSHRNDDNNVPILHRCGIREHVCDILEGGENAFKDRENKYGFFKI